MAPFRDTIAAALLFLLFSTLTLARSEPRGRSGARWVDIWASMPQLTEPANLPSAPFVREIRREFEPTRSFEKRKNGTRSD